MAQGQGPWFSDKASTLLVEGSVFGISCKAAVSERGYSQNRPMA